MSQRDEPSASPDVMERASRLRGGRGINAARWQQVERLFHEALSLGDDARAAWLEDACGSDVDLRVKVESMVASARRGDALLEGNAIDEAAPLLADIEEAESLAGTELAHYHLERRLGRGGMGEVYLARDGRLGRQVAVKLLDPALGADRRSQARFLEEARVAALLDHPNVCTIHEVGEHEGRPFLVMQYVAGRTLKELIGGQPLPPEVLMSLAVQVGEALAAAHELGIIHRDVKAANVMVTPQGLAKVLDFGIAKRLEVEVLGDSTAATAAGTILGTPGSMAPEQAAGARTDRRSDIFSFGVLLYEMATGRTPFPGTSWAERMTAVLYEPHPPFELAPGMPASLPSVVDRALAKQPADRYDSMSELLTELRGGATQPAVRIPPLRLRQQIRYLRTSDGVQLAWAEVGKGPLLVKAANWLSHLEFEWESPFWRHWLLFFAERFRFVRYDERGCGMTDREVKDLTFPRRVADFDQVIAAAAPSEPFALLGMSQGASVAIDYAVRHPEQVSHLLIYGGYAKGWARRGSRQAQREYRALTALIRLGWGSDHPAYLQAFTMRFAPEATHEQIDWFNELCRRTASPAMAAALLESRGSIDVAALLPQVKVPTLVLHSRGDVVCPVAEGRRIAAAIPGARFVELESRNHVLLEHEPAWQRFQEAVAEFTGCPAGSTTSAATRALRA